MRSIRTFVALFLGLGFLTSCDEKNSEVMKSSQIQEIGIGETRSEVEKFFGNPGLVFVEDLTTFHYFSDNSEGTVAVRYDMTEGVPQVTDKVVEVSLTRVSEQGKELIDLLRNHE